MIKDLFFVISLTFKKFTLFLTGFMDNIFVNTQIHNQTSDNVTTSISDRVEKILETKNVIGKDQITNRDFENINEIEFKCDILKLTGRMQPKTMMYIHLGFEISLQIFNTCLDRHATLKIVLKKDERVLQKPWITDGIKTLIKEISYINTLLNKKILS